MERIFKERHIIIVSSILIIVLIFMVLSSNRDYKELEYKYINNSIIKPLEHFSRTLSDLAYFLNEAVSNGQVTNEELNLINFTANNSLLFFSDFDQNYRNMIADNGSNLNTSIMYTRLTEVRDNTNALSKRDLSNNNGQSIYILNEKDINSLESYRKLLENYSGHFTSMLELIQEEKLYTRASFEKSEEWKKFVTEYKHISTK